MKLAATGDMRCSTADSGRWATRFAPVVDEADALLLAGNLTETGDPAELEVLIDELAALTIPVVAVLGAQDYDGGRAWLLSERLRRAGIACLEGAATVLDDVTIVGAMGVEGGFSRAPTRRWSYAERQIMGRLQHYLATATSRHRVVLLHHVPAAAMASGEDKADWPMLGSSALETAIDAAGADVVIHAHATQGAPEGRTARGVPIFNVSLPLLERLGYARPYRVLDGQSVTR